MKTNLDDDILGKVSKAKMKIIEEKKTSNPIPSITVTESNSNTNSNNIFFPNREEIQKENENVKKHLRTDFRPRTLNSTSAVTNFKKNFSEKPQTTMDKIVILMKGIKDRLLIHNEIEAVADVDWITKEIVTNNIYKVKVEEKEENSFYDEYSNLKSEKLFGEDIIKSGKLKE